MELKKLENSAMELTLTLQADKIEETYKKALSDYAKKLTIKGFRQGKAPISIVESKYGEAIREEATFKLMEENLEASYKDIDVKQRPLPYCTPVLQNEDQLVPFKPNQDITYSVVYDVVPEVTLPEYKNLTVEAKTIKVTDQEVDQEVEKLRQQNAMIVAKNGPITQGDIVTMNYAELDDQGNDIENTKRDDFTFTVGSSYNFYKLDKEIEGLQKGDKTVIEKTYADDSGMGTDYLGKTVKIRVEIKEVKFKDIPTLDDEFAQDVKEEYKTVADLRESIKKQLEERAENENKNYKLDAIVKAIAEKTEIAIPRSMIEAQLEQDWKSMISRFGMKEEDVIKLLSANGGGKAEFINSRRDATSETIKCQLILEQIKEEQKFQVTDEELEQELQNYGEDINKDNPNYEAFKIYAQDDVEYRKAKDFLLENNTFTELTEDKKEQTENENE